MFHFLDFFFILIRLVEETLEPLDPDRRAFRLVGGVLVRCVIFLCFRLLSSLALSINGIISLVHHLTFFFRWNELSGRYYPRSANIEKM